MAQIITKELQETLIKHPEHKNVYFDALGRHYFIAYLLKKDKDDQGEPELYANGLVSHREVIKSQFNIDNRTEVISKGDPRYKIVETMTREQVLSATPKIEGQNIAQQIVNLSENDKSAILAQLGMTSDVIELLKKIKSGELTPDAPPALPTSQVVKDK